MPASLNWAGIGNFLLDTVFFVETIHTAVCRSKFLTSSIEWVTFVAELYYDFLFYRACFECVTARACYCCSFVIWMNSLFHIRYSSRPEPSGTELLFDTSALRNPNMPVTYAHVSYLKDYSKK